MNQWGYEDDDTSSQGDTTELSGPKALRDAYKAQQKLLEDIQTQLQAERDERKKEKLSTVFESLGVPGAADLYQGEPDPEKAKAWVQTMQAAFGTGNVQGNTPPVVDVTPALSAESQAQLQRMTEAGQQGTPLSGMDAAFAAVGDAQNINDLIAGFQNATRSMG